MYFSHPDSESNSSALYNGIGLVSCALLSSCLTNPFRMYMLQIGLQIRVALASMIYNKVYENENGKRKTKWIQTELIHRPSTCENRQQSVVQLAS